MSEGAFFFSSDNKRFRFCIQSEQILSPASLGWKVEEINCTKVGSLVRKVAITSVSIKEFCLLRAESNVWRRFIVLNLLLSALDSMLQALVWLLSKACKRLSFRLSSRYDPISICSIQLGFLQCLCLADNLFGSEANQTIQAEQTMHRIPSSCTLDTQPIDFAQENMTNPRNTYFHICLVQWAFLTSLSPFYEVFL